MNAVVTQYLLARKATSTVAKLLKKDRRLMSRMIMVSEQLHIHSVKI